ncbi:MAG: hypothetical protein M3455_06980, partial [Actinomycetota bacterium]|nr:hypothetical protein [Actinomycetota bacterium]
MLLVSAESDPAARPADQPPPVRGPAFSVAVRGYSRVEVDHYIASSTHATQAAWLQQEALRNALAQARAEVVEARAAVAPPTNDPPTDDQAGDEPGADDQAVDRPPADEPAAELRSVPRPRRPGWNQNPAARAGRMLGIAQEQADALLAASREALASATAEAEHLRAEATRLN